MSDVKAHQRRALAHCIYAVNSFLTRHAGHPDPQAFPTRRSSDLAPSVVVSISDPELNASETATVTFAFSEAPVGFTLDDATAGGGSLSDLQMVDAMHYTATFTPAAATETAAASVSVAAGSYADAA